MFGKISFHKHFNIREIVMHCGFLSNSFLHLTHIVHIVALYTFIVLLSYLMLLIYIYLVFQFAHFVEGDKI